MDFPAPPTLSAGRRRLLSRRIERALRHCFGADVSLHDVVRQVVLDLGAAGVPRDAIHTVLTHAIESHGKRQALDRASIIAGLPTSQALERQVRAWVDAELGQPTDGE